MKRSRFTESQIISILNQVEAGSPVPDLCRQRGISNATFYMDPPGLWPPTMWSEMSQRTAKKEQHGGKAFSGHSLYPKCCGTL